jgi:Domain of unknown function (DUF1906)
MHRRRFLHGVGATIGAAGPYECRPAFAQGADVHSSRVRVIDASLDVTAHVSSLKAASVIAIGRYYGRPAPADGCLYPEKLLTASELQAIEAAGLSVVSVFQHCAGHCSRFRESYRKGIEDASAAVHSAQILGQPKGTPIYFGIDFDPKPSTATGTNPQCELRDETIILRLIRDYFRHVCEIVWPAGWTVGVYGAGATCTYLQNEQLDNRKLAEYYWLSASIGHLGHAAFFKSGAWHLYQNKIDIALDYLGVPLEVDTDVTNPLQPDFGQWRRDKAPGQAPGVPSAVARALLTTRAFVPVTTKTCFKSRTAGGALTEETPLPDLNGRTVRVLKEYPEAGSSAAIIEASLFEGETTTVFFPRTSLIVGLTNNMP